MEKRKISRGYPYCKFLLFSQCVRACVCYLIKRSEKASFPPLLCSLLVAPPGFNKMIFRHVFCRKKFKIVIKNVSLFNSCDKNTNAVSDVCMLKQGIL